jgi:hypothetical protein
MILPSTINGFYFLNGINILPKIGIMVEEFRVIVPIFNPRGLRT